MKKRSSAAKSARKDYVPVETIFAEWDKNPKFRKAYEALEEEFSLVSAIIEARTRSGLTQQELATRMGAKQSLVARLERGGTMPSTRTLRRFAEATGSRLKISFEPVRRKGSRAG